MQLDKLKKLGDFYRSQGKKIVCVSGGFDPIHTGHLELILGASLLGELVVLVNGDEFLMKKKEYVFMPAEDRLKVVTSIKGVSQAYIYDGDTVERGLEALRPDYFVNGGDRVPGNLAQSEVDVCEKCGIEMVFNGKKVCSSSDLCKQFYKNYLKVRFRAC
jgi:cytidyltransferase-like protein